MRRAAALAAAGLCALTLSACQAGPVTTIEITGPAQARLTVGAQFDGEAADAILADQSTLDDLLTNVSRLAGSKPAVQAGDHRLSVSAEVDATQLGRMNLITGVSSVTAKAEGSNTLVTVKMEQPTELIAAIKKAASRRQDAQAVADTMISSARVSVSVSFPGDATTVKSAGVDPAVDGSTVRVTRPLEAKGSASFTATGPSQGSGNLQLTWILAAGGIAAVALGLLVAVRSRRPR